MKFIVDANQAYKDTEEAVRVLTEVGEILGKVILVEEPCPKAIWISSGLLRITLKHDGFCR